MIRFASARQAVRFGEYQLPLRQPSEPVTIPCAMGSFVSKTALVQFVAIAVAACSPMKRLDLIDERTTDVVASTEAGATSSTLPAVDSTSLESIPTIADPTSDTTSTESSTSEPDGATSVIDTTSSVAETTTSEASSEPTWPPSCPPDRPYPFNGQCVQCYIRGSTQCWPGYSCEIARLKCEPLCSTDQDCIFRPNTLPVCDKVYRSCRFCLNDSECAEGLICQGQCVPPYSEPVPGSDSTQSDGLQSTTVPLDKGAP